MDIETYKKVGEIIRIIRMCAQVEEMACLHVEKLLADCMELGDIAVDEHYDFGDLPGLKDDSIQKIELKRSSDKKVYMVFHDPSGNVRETSIASLGILNNTMQIFNYLSNKILENLSPEIKKAMDEAQQESDEDSADQ